MRLVWLIRACDAIFPTERNGALSMMPFGALRFNSLAHWGAFFVQKYIGCSNKKGPIPRTFFAVNFP
jgi:hypothetical protein